MGSLSSNASRPAPCPVGCSGRHHGHQLPNTAQGKAFERNHFTATRHLTSAIFAAMLQVHLTAIKDRLKVDGPLSLSSTPLLRRSLFVYRLPFRLCPSTSARPPDCGRRSKQTDIAQPRPPDCAGLARHRWPHVSQAVRPVREGGWGRPWPCT